MIKLSDIVLFSESVLDDEETYKETKELLEAIVEGFGDWVNQNSVGLDPSVEFDQKKELKQISWQMERNFNSGVLLAAYMFSSERLKGTTQWFDLRINTPSYFIIIKPEDFFFRINCKLRVYIEEYSLRKKKFIDKRMHEVSFTFNITDVNEWYRVYETKLKEFENKIYTELSEIREEETKASQTSS